MVKVRLARGGAKKKPFYIIVATDSRKPRDSGYIERLGYFNPVAKGQEVRLQLDEEKLNQWINKGAQLTERVKQLYKEIKNPDLHAKRIAKQQAKIQAQQSKAPKAKTTETKAETKAETAQQ